MTIERLVGPDGLTEETRDVLLLQSLRASLEGAFRELAEILDFAAHAP